MQITNHLIQIEFPVKLNKFFSVKNLISIISFMQKDKKNINKKINLILLKGIGKPIFNLNFDPNKLRIFFKKELRN